MPASPNGSEQVRPSRRSVLKVGAASAVAVPVVAACGPGTGGGAGGDGAPQQGGTLRVGVAGGSSADTVDGHKPVDNTDIARTFALYDTLTEFAPDYTVQMVLAESLEPNAEATEWTATLRDGLTFHDGSPITAESVVFSLRRITDPDDPKTGASSLGALDRDALEAVDERTVRIVCTEAFVTLPEVLAEYYNCIVPEDYDPAEPVGSGPFKFQSFTAGDRSVFTRYEDYWRENEPHLDELHIINFPDETARVNALLGGQVDVITQVPHSQVSVLQGQPNLSVLESETGMWLPFTMRVDKAPFDDVRVRQAFRLIVDRQQMIDQALSGHGAVGNDLYARFDPAYAEDLPQREQDIAKAKELLDEAGHGDGLQVELVTGEISAGVVAAAEVFAEQAKEAGVTVKLRRVSSSEFFGDNYLSWDFAQDFWATRGYLSQAAQGSLPDAPFNETHWDDEEWVELVEQARQTVDDDERDQLIRQAQQIEYERGGYIVWGFVNVLDGFHTKVKGLETSVTGHPLASYGFHKMWIQE